MFLNVSKLLEKEIRQFITRWNEKDREKTQEEKDAEYRTIKVPKDQSLKQIQRNKEMAAQFFYAVQRWLTKEPAYEDRNTTIDQRKEYYRIYLDTLHEIHRTRQPFTFAQAAYCLRTNKTEPTNPDSPVRRPKWGESGHCLNNCIGCPRSDIPLQT